MSIKFFLIIFTSFYVGVSIAQTDSLFYDTEIIKSNLETKEIKRLVSTKCKTLKQIDEFSNLEELYIENKSGKLRFNICNLRELKVINSVAHKLKFDSKIDSLPSLEVLNCYDRKFHTIPQFIYHCHKLKRLHLYLVSDEVVSNDLKNLNNLNSLELIFENLRSFPSGITELISLNKLVLETYPNNSTLINLPNNLSSKESIEFLKAPLDLLDNYEALVKMPNLKILMVKSCKDFDERGTKLKGLEKLERIYIENFSDIQKKRLQELLPNIVFAEYDPESIKFR